MVTGGFKPDDNIRSQSRKALIRRSDKPGRRCRAGGLTGSELWPRIIASALNLELHIPRWGETSSLGAALWTLVGTGVIDDFEKIKDLIPLDRSYSPVAEDAKLYQELYLVYKALYSALGPSFDKIANLYPLVP